MLNKHHKEEMLKDSRSDLRREDFLAAKSKGTGEARSMDIFLDYLKSIQSIFPLIEQSRSVTTSRNHKL